MRDVVIERGLRARTALQHMQQLGEGSRILRLLDAPLLKVEYGVGEAVVFNQFSTFDDDPLLCRRGGKILFSIEIDEQLAVCSLDVALSGDAARPEIEQNHHDLRSDH